MNESNFPGPVPTALPIAVAASALVALAVGCADDDPAETDQTDDDATAPIVEVATIETTTTERERQFTGPLRPLNRRSIQAPSSGTVAAFDIREGELVEAGQTIGRLEQTDADARHDSLVERRDHLREELDRWERLAEADAAGPSEINQARMRLLETEQQLAETEAELRRQRLVAPVTGRIADTRVSTGSTVTEGEPLAEVDEAQELAVDLSVPTSETRFFDDLDHLEVTDDAGRTYGVESTIFGDDDHRSFVTVDVVVDADDDRPRRADVTYRRDERLMVVPWTAVASEDDRHWVAVVTGDPPRIEHRTVELGRGLSRGIEVLEGLQDGDRVVRYEPRSQPEDRRIEPVEDDR